MCRSRRELSNEYLLAKIGFDTAENEPCEVCPLSAYRSPRYLREDSGGRVVSHRPSDVLEYREPEAGISDDMSLLLDDLYGVADVFARSFLFIVEDIPRVFGTVLQV